MQRDTGIHTSQPPRRPRPTGAASSLHRPGKARAEWHERGARVHLPCAACEMRPSAPVCLDGRGWHTEFGFFHFHLHFQNLHRRPRRVSSVGCHASMGGWVGVVGSVAASSGIGGEDRPTARTAKPLSSVQLCWGLRLLDGVFYASKVDYGVSFYV
jgi:hypothetical protein